ncbi:hypothetical protein BCV70DRAFT_30904 [Testicularia cyperi]|uniref:Uncharacterized protein n=1 Tax=Testicularia cyperi TaxID=1882483 RepID=A0A317XLI2_9BASI|nr:hypothetical protein BCV70DRAFT_30904 [Testicularia cyperi]
MGPRWDLRQCRAASPQLQLPEKVQACCRLPCRSSFDSDLRAFLLDSRAYTPPKSASPLYRTVQYCTELGLQDSRIIDFRILAFSTAASFAFAGHRCRCCCRCLGTGRRPMPLPD